MATRNLTAADFNETIENNGIVLVDFWAAWCGPCRAFAPVYDELSQEHPDIVFGKVDTEAERELAQAFQIMSIPTLMAFRDQVLLYAQPGALPRQALAEIISQVEALDMDEVRRQIAEQDAKAE
ncbi:thioredoxin [Ferrimicrobium sp.]|uniref:thioredoxin n=1 Tax=Ferrimicrobium sp. TaxID=2926050 RepID=UPI0026328D11|nr:thioredoxin [Ferrimicrobium sp.]